MGLLEDLIEPVASRRLREGVKVGRRDSPAQDARLEDTLTKLKAIGVGQGERRDGKLELDKRRRVGDLDDP